MKANTTFIFAGIMSAIIGNAYATGENTVTSKSYVDAQDALKQDVITTGLLTLEGDRGEEWTLPASLVSYDTTNDLTGDVIGLLTSNVAGNYSYNDYTTHWWTNGFLSTDTTIATARAVADMGLYLDSYIQNGLQAKQDRIPASGYYDQYNTYHDHNNEVTGWLGAKVKGTGLVTKTSEDGVVGERKIFEATDVANYHDSQLSANQQAIQDISIPTVGAMMTAISNGVSAATPTGTANTIANYGANGALDSGIAMYTGAAAYNSTNDSAKIPTMAGVATYAQAKMTCAGWPESVPVNQRTDENCWLWYKN